MQEDGHSPSQMGIRGMFHYTQYFLTRHGIDCTPPSPPFPHHPVGAESGDQLPQCLVILGGPQGAAAHVLWPAELEVTLQALGCGVAVAQLRSHELPLHGRRGGTLVTQRCFCTRGAERRQCSSTLTQEPCS